MNQLDPRNFRVEREYIDVPAEDYNEGKDYSFGMKRMMNVILITVSAMLAMGLTALLFIAYFGVPN
jgi:hypothetical protein